MKLNILVDESDALMEVESNTLDKLTRTKETEHYVFRFAAGSMAEQDMDAMINEQEQAIARIQQNMNYFIQEALGVLEDSILDKEEIISEKEAIELERTEYFRTLDELAAIYA